MSCCCSFSLLEAEKRDSLLCEDEATPTQFREEPNLNAFRLKSRERERQMSNCFWLTRLMDLKIR